MKVLSWVVNIFNISTHLNAGKTNTLNKNFSQSVVVYAFNLNTHEAPGLWVLGHFDLDSEFQDSYSYIMRLWLERKWKHVIS